MATKNDNERSAAAEPHEAVTPSEPADTSEPKKARRKPARRFRAKQVIIWMTESEHARLTAAAQVSGLGLGPWLRSLGLAEIDRLRCPKCGASLVRAPRAAGPPGGGKDHV